MDTTATSGAGVRGIKFVSLGMVVLDELRLPNGRILYDVPGGSGLYSTLGARMASSACPQTVGCFVLAGKDFPDQIQHLLGHWDVRPCVQRSSDKLSTRGLVEYGGTDFKERIFSYTTPTLQPTPADLPTSLISSAAFHILASPENLTLYTNELRELRIRDASGNIGSKWPIIAWEPLPSSCAATHKDKQIEAGRLVDVYSPNHTEFLSIFDPNSNRNTEFDKSLVEKLAKDLVELLGSQTKCDKCTLIIIRCAEHGSLVLSRDHAVRWFPAYHGTVSTNSAMKVMDTTGAGNAFLGAFTARFADTGDVAEAMVYGSVASSFVVEQVGVPLLTRILDAPSSTGVSKTSDIRRELWNGINFSERVHEYKRWLEMKDLDF
ncbi:Ribokinase-like protein [Naviculisporaceae sp. PSN 640]